MASTGPGAVASCLCERGWGGLDCSEPACAHKCSGHGICTDGDCWCDPGWSGPECAWRRCPVDCGGHGVCGAKGACACNPGWAGFDCSRPAGSAPTVFAGVSCAAHCLGACQTLCIGGEGCIGTCVDACVPACLDEGQRTAAGGVELPGADVGEAVVEAAEAEEAAEVDERRQQIADPWARSWQMGATRLAHAGKVMLPK